jgi:hypothetical protein
MIRLTSLLHRQELEDIMFRWMCDDLRQEDCDAVKRIVNFNVYLVNLYLNDFCSALFNHLYDDPIWTFVVNTKGEFKDFILNAAPYHNERLDYIRERYRKYPEDFYRSTPFRGRVYCLGPRENPAYLGHSRIKRFRRVAEKTSRRMIGVVFEEIKKGADALAWERAAQLGISKERLITLPEEQQEEFIHAERRFLKKLRQGVFRPDEDTLTASAIHDVAGVKVIAEEDKTAGLETFLNDGPATVLEKEKHRGNYEATNYIVNLKLDLNDLARRAPDQSVAEVFGTRGMDRDAVISDFNNFVESAEDSVNVEVIISNYPNVIESEFGRSMHEEMILAQRNQGGYRSSVARNVRYIVEYLFLFAISGKKNIQQLPVRLWEKTIPDIYDHAIRNLWNIPTMPVL